MKRSYSPESMMMHHDYSPKNGFQAVKMPLVQSSTFVFDTAEQGKAYFELAYGLREAEEGEEIGMIYSRLDNPNLSVVENRLALWDKADGAALFASGMAAISTVLLEFLKPGDLVLYSTPSYGGTVHFMEAELPAMGVEVVSFNENHTKEEIRSMINEKEGKLSLIFTETPGNPTNSVIDISMCKEIADEFSTEDKKVFLAVDNTYMGPIWCNPIEFGADMVIYSATKFIGGHSDLTAGVVLGNNEIVGRIKVKRTFLGNMASPHTAWLLSRSLETLKVRVVEQAKNAEIVALFLSTHPAIEKIYYPSLMNYSEKKRKLYNKQYRSGGSMIAIDVKGGEKEAFSFLNNLHLFQLAVSLGSTESLCQHPYSMTHAGMEIEDKLNCGITESFVRLSIGLENVYDLINDLKFALEISHPKMKVELKKEEEYLKLV